MVALEEIIALENLYGFNLNSYKYLSSGSLNEVFLLNTNHGDKVAKFYFKPLGERWVFSQENIQSILMDNGMLCKNFLYEDKDGNFFTNFNSSLVSISNYLNYRTFSLRNENDIVLAAKYLSRLHLIKVSNSRKKIDWYELPSRSNFKIDYNILNTIGKFRQNKIINQAEKAIQSIDILEKYVKDIPWTIIHGDFHSNNILVNKNKLITIDWDDACYGPRILDLSKAMFSLCKKKNGSFSFSSKYLKLFFEEYCKKINITKTELALIPSFLRVIFTINFNYYSHFINLNNSRWYFDWSISACDSISEFNRLLDAILIDRELR